MKQHLGMYVHMHWGYNHPYAARTWSIEDWRNYAGGLAALGYNTIMIWPMPETVPDPPTPSDIAHFQKIGQVIDMLHSEFGMSVFITMGPNTVGNDKAAEYTFEDRPFFETDIRLNPGNPEELDRLVQFRRKLFEYIRNADAFSIIDSDPGGYIGSTDDEFVELLWRHLDMINDLNPSAYLYYWMWMGWECYNKMWQSMHEGDGSMHYQASITDFENVLKGLLKHPERKWNVFSCWPMHQELIEKLGIENRTFFNPYNLVEIEPTIPLTNHNPQMIFDELQRYDPQKMQLGIMANAQTHVVQLPHTYYFAHFANGGTPENADLTGFAEELITGMGKSIADVWKTIRSSDSARMRELILSLKEYDGKELHIGKYGGLILRGPERFLTDLQLQLAFRADVVDFIKSVEQGIDCRRCLRSLISSWRAWQKRTGFADAYVDTQDLHTTLQKLGDDTINGILADFDNWREPSVRNGILLRLLDAVQSKLDQL